MRKDAMRGTRCSCTVNQVGEMSGPLGSGCMQKNLVFSTLYYVKINARL